MKEYRMLIADKWMESSSGKWIDVINPANSEGVGRVPQGTSEEAETALRAAGNAFLLWSAKPAKERAQIIKQAVANCRENADEIASLITKEQGKPFNEAKGEVKGALDTVEHFAEESCRILGEIIPTDTKDRLSFVTFQPLGVVSAIVPWNYPVNLLCWQLGPALAAGCTVVAKPPSQTPLAVLFLARCLLEGGLPPGVLNVVTGPGSTVGKKMAESPLSQKVAFTGSTEVGREIISNAGFKKVSLELGGSSPLIILKDAVLSAAVKGGVSKTFRNTGQICNSINRIYVEKDVYEEYVEQFIALTAKLTIGDGMKNPAVDLGPMIDESGRQRVREHIQDALENGAKLCYGGKEPEGKEYEQGYFFEPTVLTGVNHKMRVMREETFGPIAPIMPVADFEEAIELANDSNFGLVGYIYTNDMRKAVAAGRLMECGSIGINEVSFSGAPYPYPAWKESGTGVGLSHHGLRDYLKIKHVRLRLP